MISESHLIILPSELPAARCHLRAESIAAGLHRLSSRPGVIVVGRSALQSAYFDSPAQPTKLLRQHLEGDGMHACLVGPGLTLTMRHASFGHACAAMEMLRSEGLRRRLGRLPAMLFIARVRAAPFRRVLSRASEKHQCCDSLGTLRPAPSWLALQGCALMCAFTCES
jgi:hypothetical protein